MTLSMASAKQSASATRVPSLSDLQEICGAPTWGVPSSLRPAALKPDQKPRQEAKDSEVMAHLTPDELKACFDRAWYLRNVDAIYRRLGLLSP